MANLYNTNHRQWDHFGYITPEIGHTENTVAINFEGKPAAWLPVVRTESYTEFAITVPAGKVVALDREGRVVPAGYKYVFEAAGGDTILTYLATDVTNKVTDLTTGAVLTGATTYTQTQVTTALRNRGLISASETARDFISWPIGYSPYNYYSWCGGNGLNPGEYKQHNFNGQHGVAVNNDAAIRLPLVPAQEAVETQGGGLAIADTAIVFGTGGWKSSTGIHATPLYTDLVAVGNDVVAMVFNKWPVAKITNDTPITESSSTLAGMTEVDSIAALLVSGSDYFYIDYDHGVLFLFETDGNAIPTGFNVANTVTYFTYEDAAAGSSTIALATGNIKPGDWLTFNNTSDYVKWTPDIGTCFGGASGDSFAADPDYGTGATATISAQLEAFAEQSRNAVIGQALGYWVHPRDALDKVKTQFTVFSNAERNSGSATEGRPQALPLAGASNLEVIINFCNR